MNPDTYDIVGKGRMHGCVILLGYESRNLPESTNSSPAICVAAAYSVLRSKLGGAQPSVREPYKLSAGRIGGDYGNILLRAGEGKIVQ